MKNLNLENETVQSILHMIVNAGEHESYPAKTKEKMLELAAEFFDSDMEQAKRYINAQIIIEVYEHIETYMGAYTDTDMVVIAEVIEEFTGTLSIYIK